MESAGNGIYILADVVIRANASNNGSVSAAAGGGKGGSSFSPAVIAIVGILGTAFLLVSYYTMVAKFCRGGSRGRWMIGSWTGQRGNRLNEEAQGLQAAGAQEQEQGLEQAEIEAIPVVEFLRRVRSGKKWGHDDDDAAAAGGLECAVCLSEFEEAERLRLLPSCCHAFHLPCIDAWLRSHASCPLCRTPIHSALHLLDLASLSDGPAASPPLLFRAGRAAAGVTSPRAPLADVPPYRLISISPGAIAGHDENNNVIQSLPSSNTTTPKMEALAHEQREQFLTRRLGAGMAISTSPTTSTKQTPQLANFNNTSHLFGRHGQWLMHLHENNATHSDEQRFSLAFGRCFSTGRSKESSLFNATTPIMSNIPFHLNSSSTLDHDSQQLLPHSILLSSPSPKQYARISMQRSRSYGVGASFLPAMLRRQSPFYHEQNTYKLPSLSKSATSSLAIACSSSSFATTTTGTSPSHDDRSVGHKT